VVIKSGGEIRQGAGRGQGSSLCDFLGWDVPEIDFGNMVKHGWGFIWDSETV
jgi:hypothetical protein